MKKERPLKIWLIKEGEDLPFQQNIRLMRTGMLAKYFSEHGHEVTWWTSTFRHGMKQYYAQEYKEVRINERETLIMLHSKISYKKNISLHRIKYCQILAKRFSEACQKKERPDIILCSWPTPQFAKEAVKYGKKNGVPVIIDVRDRWPDIFASALPKPFQRTSSLLLYPMKYDAKKTLRQATGICSVAAHGLQWGCAYAGREPNITDRCIYIGNSKVDMDEKDIERQIKNWQELGVEKTTWNICFFSTLSRRGIDLDTVIHAVNKLSQKYQDIRLIIGGKGDAEEYLKSVANQSPNIVFAGWLDQAQMNSLMSISKCGMYCLRNIDDLKDTFSNKAIQYLSGGLPVINSLQGFAKRYLEEEKIGYTYQEGLVADCAEKIEKLYLDEAKRKEMSLRALNCFKTKFDSDIVNAQFEEYLYTVLDVYKNEGQVE